MSATEILIRFDFPVDQSGYEIVEIPDTHHMGPEDVAISDTPYIIGKSSVYRDHRDFFENFPIHKILAEMDERKSSDDDVINFCNKYGLLWHNTPTSIPVDLPRLHRDRKSVV